MSQHQFRTRGPLHVCCTVQHKIFSTLDTNQLWQIFCSITNKVSCTFVDVCLRGVVGGITPLLVCYLTVKVP